MSTAETFGEEAEEGGGEVLDLMEALRRSVEKNKKPAPKKAPAKKAPAAKKKASA